MHSTNYRDTLITPAPDCPVAAGTIPEKAGSVAAVQHGLLTTASTMTSDDLLYAAHRARGGNQTRQEFFAKPQACLRASPLVKKFGWGVHHDGDGRIALVGCETDEYRRLFEDSGVKKTPGMRQARK